MSDKVDLRVDFCSHEAAKYAVEHWHYSKSMPTPPIIKIGVWENEVFIGCVLFSRGANKNLGSFAKLKSLEVCELTRVALNKHITQVTKIISFCIGYLQKNSPGLRLIISYADKNQNHIGIIYQAGNWVYTGETPPNYLYKDKSGRIWHQRQVSATGIRPQYRELRYVPKIKDCEKIPQLGKHRYLYPLDRAMRKQIEPLRKPYPKRELCGLGEIDNAPGSNRETEGARPISPLLKEN
jgi:hypothetical protein